MIQSFFEKVDMKGGPDSCWPWKSNLRNGYGIFKNKGKNYSAHRLSYQMFNGPIPKDGSCFGTLLVLHRCDNPRCVNPSHLFLGTHKENMEDMVNKGRQGFLIGEEHKNTKLTNEQVLQIRSLYSLGSYTQQKLSNEYGVSVMTISNIVRYKYWAHL